MIGSPLQPAVLQGPRVQLRPYQHGFDERELQALYAWSLDSDLLSMCGTQPLSLDYRRFCELFQQQVQRKPMETDQLYAILDETGRIIGHIGLFGLHQQVDPLGISAPGGVLLQSDRAELGIMIGERPAWGRGLGREAVGLLVDHAFSVMDLSQIVLYTFPDNIRAQRSFAAAGFASSRQLRRFSLSQGAHDEVEMRISPRDRRRVARAAQERSPATQAQDVR